MTVIEGERHDLASTFLLKCSFCGKHNRITTSGQHRSGLRGPPTFNINTRAALGCLHAGIGQTHINNVLSTLNVPTLNSVTFKLREREVGKAVENIAKGGCQNYLQMERGEALEKGIRADENSLVPIPCSFDTGWQRRGKRHNSRTGQAAVMSLSSGKVLGYTTRTKSCRFCDSAKAKGKTPKAHDCCKNHTASSKAMEPDTAVQLFNTAINQRVKFSA